MLADRVRLCDRRLGSCGFRVRWMSVGVAGALGGLGGPRRAGFRRPFRPLAGGRGGWYGIGRRRPSWVGQVGLCARSLRTRGFWGRRAGEGVARALGGAVGRFRKIRPGWKVRLRHKNYLLPALPSVSDSISLSPSPCAALSITVASAAAAPLWAEPRVLRRTALAVPPLLPWSPCLSVVVVRAASVVRARACELPS